MSRDFIIRSLKIMRRGRLPVAVIIAVFLALGWGVTRAGAKGSDPAKAPKPSEQDEMCLACHCDKGMTTKRGPQTVSLFVDGKKFAGSIHGGLSCTGCHADLEGKDFPHPKPAKVQCGTCHDSEAKQHANSLHGKAVARGPALDRDGRFDWRSTGASTSSMPASRVARFALRGNRSAVSHRCTRPLFVSWPRATIASQPK